MTGSETHVLTRAKSTYVHSTFTRTVHDGSIICYTHTRCFPSRERCHQNVITLHTHTHIEGLCLQRFPPVYPYLWSYRPAAATVQRQHENTRHEYRTTTTHHMHMYVVYIPIYTPFPYAPWNHTNKGPTLLSTGVGGVRGLYGQHL